MPQLNSFMADPSKPVNFGCLFSSPTKNVQKLSKQRMRMSKELLGRFVQNHLIQREIGQDIWKEKAK